MSKNDTSCPFICPSLFRSPLLRSAATAFGWVVKISIEKGKTTGTLCTNFSDTLYLAPQSEAGKTILLATKAACPSTVPGIAVTCIFPFALKHP